MQLLTYRELRQSTANLFTGSEVNVQTLSDRQLEALLLCKWPEKKVVSDKKGGFGAVLEKLQDEGAQEKKIAAERERDEEKEAASLQQLRDDIRGKIAAGDRRFEKVEKVSQVVCRVIVRRKKQRTLTFENF
jgi:hypothetical protein